MQAVSRLAGLARSRKEHDWVKRVICKARHCNQINSLIVSAVTGQRREQAGNRVYWYRPCEYKNLYTKIKKASSRETVIMEMSSGREAKKKVMTPQCFLITSTHCHQKLGCFQRCTLLLSCIASLFLSKDSCVRCLKGMGL